MRSSSVNRPSSSGHEDECGSDELMNSVTVAWVTGQWLAAEGDEKTLEKNLPRLSSDCFGVEGAVLSGDDAMLRRGGDCGRRRERRYV